MRPKAIARRAALSAAGSARSGARSGRKRAGRSGKPATSKAPDSAARAPSRPEPRQHHRRGVAQREARHEGGHHQRRRPDAVADEQARLAEPDGLQRQGPGAGQKEHPVERSERNSGPPSYVGSNHPTGGDMKLSTVVAAAFLVSAGLALPAHAQDKPKAKAAAKKRSEER